MNNRMVRTGLGRVSARAKLSKLRRAGETAEQRETRLKKQRERAKERRANETPEQKENRQADMRKRRRQKSLQVAYKKRVQRFIDVLAKNKVKTRAKQGRKSTKQLKKPQNEVHINDYCEQMMIEGEASNEIYLTDNTSVEKNLEEQQIKSDIETEAKVKNKGQLKQMIEGKHLNEIYLTDNISIEMSLEEKIKNNVESEANNKNEE